ncbi:MAG TPA: hypothetical protein VF599_05720 [Pyrinomonadaceae bacterium]|jgi:hypothetical protein
MKKPLFIILIAFAFVSCANQKPKHPIYGKWESTAAPKFILDFDENNSLRSQLLSAGGKTYEWNYRYVIDGDSARFDDDSSGAIAKITARLENENKLGIGCVLGRHSDGKGMIDAPPLCGYDEFVRMKE